MLEMNDCADHLLANPPPSMTPEDAQEVLRSEYGLLGTARRLGGERDLNFAVSTGAQPVAVLKISNSNETFDNLDFQIKALEHIGHSDPSLGVQRVRYAHSGSAIIEVRDSFHRPHLASLLSFLPGDTWATPQTTATHLAAVGRFLARIDLALADFHHPCEDRALLWDLSRVAEVEGLLHHIADPEVRDTAAEVMSAFASAAPAFAVLRRQVIHNDLNTHNVIVDGNSVCGVIDFGDMVRAPLINDLAVAASYHVSHGDEPLGLAPILVRAYDDALPITAEEIALLPLLIAARCVLSVAITAWRATLHPENRAYILRNSPASAAALMRLTPQKRAEAADYFASICSR